jgi:hypothetical protein
MSTKSLTDAGRLIGLALLAFVCSTPAAAQTLGTVTAVGSGGTCPATRGFDPGMTCYPATLSACPGNDNLQFVFGVEKPSVTPLGTIVLLSGDGGGMASETPSLLSYVGSYVAKGYQVVQIAWGPSAPGTDWEFTNVSGGSNPSSIRAAACRPASFLNWVRNGGIWGGNGGMCAHGNSAGSAAVAYSLAWYNAGAATASNGQGYLDKVVLENGPVFSDIEQGCEISSSGTNNQYTLMCVSPGQAGCVGWNPAQDPPGWPLEYVLGAQHGVNEWSGATGPACGNNHTQTTYNTKWLQMSVVDTTSTQQPSFNYPNTALSAWTCENTAPGVAQNNSAPQGQIFYQQFTSQSQAGNSLSVNAITGCPNTEGVDNGTVAATGQQPASGAILADMTTGAAACKARH